MTREIRALGQVEARADGEGAPRKIIGYAAVFNSPTDIGGYFTEQIAPGAFRDAIGRDDVRALFNHDDNFVLGRTTTGTLKLAEDSRGLMVEIAPPDTAWARDLIVSIERGDVSQMSFAFRAVRQEWDETVDPPIRTILEAELLDVSPVTYPAYADTEVGVRALAEARARVAADLAPAANAVRKLRSRMSIDLRQRNHSRL